MKVSVPSFSQRLISRANRSGAWLSAAAIVASLGACAADTEGRSTAMAGSSAPTGGIGGMGGSSAGAGTTGAAGTPADVPATFTAVLAILADSKNNCGLCHKMQTLGGGLVFDPSDKMGTYSALVNIASKGMQGSMCAGKTYVVPGNPDGSLVYDKVSKPKPSCGVRMPASGVVLEDAEIATIRAWIMAGAPYN